MRALELHDALKRLYDLFNDEGELEEQYPDQLSVALEKASRALRVGQRNTLADDGTGKYRL